MFLNPSFEYLIPFIALLNSRTFCVVIFYSSQLFTKITKIVVSFLEHIKHISLKFVIDSLIFCITSVSCYDLQFPVYFRKSYWPHSLKPWYFKISIPKEISPGISLEGMTLKLKLQYFGYLMQRVDSLEHMYTCGRFILIFGKTNTIM